MLEILLENESFFSILLSFEVVASQIWTTAMK